VSDPPAAPAPPPQPVAVPGNGLAVAALVLGIVGAVFGLIPLTFIIALICGILATVFGWVGLQRTKKVGAPHKGMAIAGFVLGLVAIALGIVGIIIISTAANDLNKSIEDILNSPFPTSFP
jgi:hypothetical protein